MLTIYKTPTCTYCKSVAKLLDMKGIQYKLVDISEDPELRQQVISNSGVMTVPVTVRGDWEEYVIGYNPSRLLALAKGDS